MYPGTQTSIEQPKSKPDMLMPVQETPAKAFFMLKAIINAVTMLETMILM